MKLTVFALVLLFNAFVFNTYSQNNRGKINISGQVKDSLNRPIVNAAMLVDGVKVNVKTNTKGYYKLKLKTVPNKIMVLSAIYGIYEVDFDGGKVFNITYGKESLNVTDKKKTRITRKNKINPTQPTFTNIYDYLRTKVSGIRVSRDNKVLVRGTTSFNSSVEPLFIVNQSAISNIDAIDPNEIKSVTVLKGPECASYGVRGANGVIIISTF